MAVVLVYQPRVADPVPVPWEGTASGDHLFPVSASDTNDAGGVFVGIKAPSWSADQLSGLMHQVTGGTDDYGNTVGAEPPGEGAVADPVGPLAWSTLVLSYPSDPDTTTFFYLYTFLAKVWHGAYYLWRPSLLAMRDAYTSTLLAANPDATGVEWEGNAVGSWSAPTVHVAEQLVTSQRNDGRAGGSHDTPALSGTSYLLNLTGEADFQHDPRTARLDDPASGNVLLGGTPALSGELGQQQATYTPEAALFESTGIPTRSPFGGTDMGTQFTFYAAPTAPMLDPTAWDYLTTQNVGIRQGLAANLTVAVTYTPPPYRLYAYVTVTDQPPWLRAVQRTDGLDMGGPPRAVQRATKADSLRAGTAAL